MRSYSIVLLLVLIVVGAMCAPSGIQLHSRVIQQTPEQFLKKRSTLSNGLLLAQFKNNLPAAQKKKILSNPQVKLIGQDTVMLHQSAMPDPKSFQVVDHLHQADKTQMNLSSEKEGTTVTVYAKLFNEVKDLTKEFAALQPYATAHKVSSHKIKFSIKRSHQAALDALKQNNNVVWIEEKLPMGMKNYGGNAILQSGTQDDHDYIWRHGVTGKNQLVTVGDTGLAFGNCLFYDAKNPEPSFNQVDGAHRKIYGYFQVTVDIDGQKIQSDRYDGPGGHGSHVCGSVAGRMGSNSSYPQSIQKFGGAGLDTKLVFIDLQNIQYPYLLIPEDLYKDYFPIGYNAGSRIHSNSWGCSHSALFRCDAHDGCTWNQDTPWGHKGEVVPDTWCFARTGRRCVYYCNTYGAQSAETDQFLYEHDDMLVLFSAGNDGTASLGGYTLDSPGTSKNVLTVGASMNTNQDWQMSVNYTNIQMYLDMLHFSNEQQCCDYRGPKEDLIHSVCCTSYMKQQFQNEKAYDMYNLADFSSRGPTLNDRRIKPEVVAPGNQVLSANSNGRPGTQNCQDIRPDGQNNAAVLAMSGTSMSCPLTSGSVSLIRDYFMQGFYPSGQANAADAFTPTGALMKAMAIHSAQPLTGSVVIDGQAVPLPQTWPNNFYGFGRVDLSKVLYFKNQPQDDSLTMFVKDRQHIKQGEDQVFCFRATRMFTSEFRATVVWMDPPGSPNLVKQLVNDIDLTVFVDGMLFEGNNIEGGDYVNNVEQVRAPLKLAEDKMVVVVHGGKLTTDQQQYALVVSGGFIEQYTDGCVRPY